MIGGRFGPFVGRWVDPIKRSRIGAKKKGLPGVSGIDPGRKRSQIDDRGDLPAGRGKGFSGRKDELISVTDIGNKVYLLAFGWIAVVRFVDIGAIGIDAYACVPISLTATDIGDAVDAVRDGAEPITRTAIRFGVFEQMAEGKVAVRATPGGVSERHE